MYEALVLFFNLFCYLSAIQANVKSKHRKKMNSAIKSFIYLTTKIRCRSLVYMLTPTLILTFTTNSKVRDNALSFFIGNFSKVVHRWNSIVTNLSENNAYDKRNRKYINCDCPQVEEYSVLFISLFPFLQNE